MGVLYDPLLVAGIGEEIRARLVGRRVESMLVDRQSREAWLRFPPAVGSPTTGAGGPSGEDDCSLGFLLHPERGFVLLVPGPPPGDPDARRRIRFRRLHLTAVRVPPDERLIVIEISAAPGSSGFRASPEFRLFVELHTNQWNAVLTRGADERIEEVLRVRSAGDRSLRVGQTYRLPSGARDWSLDRPDRSLWTERLSTVPRRDRRRTLLESVAWTSSINADWILAGPGAADEAALVDAAYDRYLELRTAPRAAWLLPTRTGLQPYVAPVHDGAIRSSSLLEAMLTAAEQSQVWGGKDVVGPQRADDREREEARRLEGRLRERIRRLQRRTAALRRQLEGDSAGELRGLADLLLARKHEVPRGATAVSLTDFDEREVQVPLDPRLDAVGNAERLYDRARRRERAARGIPRRIRESEDRIRKLEEGIATLHAAGPVDAVRRLAAAGHSGGAGAVPPGISLPYRRYVSSGGLEIRVGRASRANDELTFRHSSPDDIWLHARQAAGAHVILRWDRRDQNPPAGDLTEAAVLAALNSEARHSGVVAVDWTRRKYVRKPRKAPPGAVIPDRVSTLFVEPDAAVAARLTVDE